MKLTVDKPSRTKGFSLTEVLIAMSLSLLIAAAVMSALVYVSRSGFSIANYCQMDQQSRVALEMLGRDIKQCQPAGTTPLSVSIQSAGSTSEVQTISLSIPDPANSNSTVQVTYTYVASNAAYDNMGTLTRTQAGTGGSTRILIKNIKAGSFIISGSSRADPTTGNTNSFTGASNVGANIASVKQLQISLEIKSNAIYTLLTGGSSQQIITAQFSIRRKQS